MLKSFEEELIKSQMEVQEQTLHTIALEIHDNVGQLLSLTKFTLQTANLKDNLEKAQQNIDDATTLVSKSIKELRHLASILHAQNILAAGLENAIENELSWLSKNGSYEATLHFKGEKNKHLDPKKELIIFRILQELMNNILKHAEASRIDVHFEYNSLELTIKTEDNGKGFNVSNYLLKPTGLGLQNLFSRARIVGGELILTSKINEGTCGLLRIPY